MYFLQNYRKQCFQLILSTIVITTFTAASSQVMSRPDATDTKLQPNPENLKQEINYPFNKKRIVLIVAGMFGARSNIAIDNNSVVTFDRSDIQHYRQWYLSPDIDFTKIKTNRKVLKILFFLLSTAKFPAPAFKYSNGSIKAHWIGF